MKERLQKILSAAGVASRRGAEDLIKSGRVSVNGTVANLGESADLQFDEISVDGKKIAVPSAYTYIMLNKPKGYVTTMSDEKGRPCVKDLVSDLDAKVYPVGRLDMYSEGLLIMTDDGDFANKLMHPSNETRKTYHVWITGQCGPKALSTLRSPLVIDGYTITPAEVSVLKEAKEYTLLSVSIHEGRNRQIRKMCELAGLKLTRLKRVSEGNLSLGELKSGKWRYLTDEELQEIRST